MTALRHGWQATRHVPRSAISTMTMNGTAEQIRGPLAEASRLTLLEINALATSLKDFLV